MTTIQFVIIISIIGMVFIMTFFGIVFRFAKWDSTRKSGLKLEAAREKTHREIAAHVAAGALSTDDAERLIHAMWEADAASIDKAHRTLASAPNAAAAHC